MKHINFSEWHKEQVNIVYSKNQDHKIFTITILQDVEVTDIRVSKTGGRCKGTTITFVRRNVQLTPQMRNKIVWYQYTDVVLEILKL